VRSEDPSAAPPPPLRTSHFSLLTSNERRLSKMVGLPCRTAGKVLFESTPRATGNSPTPSIHSFCSPGRGTSAQCTRKHARQERRPSPASSKKNLRRDQFPRCRTSRRPATANGRRPLAPRKTNAAPSSPTPFARHIFIPMALRGNKPTDVPSFILTHVNLPTGMRCCSGHQRRRNEPCFLFFQPAQIRTRTTGVQLAAAID